MKNKLGLYIQLGLASIFCLLLGTAAVAQCPINCHIGEKQVCPYHPKHRKYNKPSINSRGERIRYVDVQTPRQQNRNRFRSRFDQDRAQAEKKSNCPINCPIGLSQPGDCPYHPKHLNYNRPTVNSRGERIRYVDVPVPRPQPRFTQDYYSNYPPGQYPPGPNTSNTVIQNQSPAGY